MSEPSGRGLTAVYWGGLAAGRLLAVPLAVRLRPATMICADLAGATLSTGALLLRLGVGSNVGVGGSTDLGGSVGVTGGSAGTGSSATWLFTGLLGFSLASIFPSVMTNAERSLAVSGRVENNENLHLE